ncbi:uncharacterized protein LOC124926638 isoform X2 [Impatiens glandulifera]|uniref:uncharacterized protein LOC124926638 isoform X2 n=1 Tax=Impatiens glandulifera TaxID=253017 RepID=UPI001FB08ED4|nr:uncharacterized protein LOC124926638 isoform X2 [Impatiens glandulifera]
MAHRQTLELIVCIYSFSSSHRKSRRLSTSVGNNNPTSYHMDSMPVNWEVLDALVIDFAKSERLLEDAQAPPSPYHGRLLTRQIRRSVETGDIDAAMDLLRLHAPSVLDDHRILFRLQKQKFIEFLRRGTPEGRDSAINCLRTALAPCALDAYPEAYEEFKHVLLAFVYDKDDQNSPVAVEWSERRRLEIAGLLTSVLRAHLHAYDPIFSMSLRYLISIHKVFCFRQGIVSPISNLIERLLPEERDPPAMPPESLYEASPFDEVDIQALAHAVELTRQGSIDGLKFARGDLFKAFQNELSRMRFNLSMLDGLIHEYCIYRGIVDSSLPSPNASEMQIQSEPFSVEQSEPVNCSLGEECVTSNPLDGETSLSNLDDNGCSSSEVRSDTVGKVLDIEERYHCESTDNLEDCSTSGVVLQSGCHHESRLAKRTRIHGTIEKSRHKWRRREEKLDPGFEELASKGMAAEAVEEINTLDPNFFPQNPTLLFKLKQVEFLKLASSGDYQSALRVACSFLGALATKDPTLLKPLKETLLTLLRPIEDTMELDWPLHDVASSLQVEFGRRLGIDEPQLMKILQATLYTHSEWFKLQMCKDRFEGLLRIDSLKEVSSSLLTGGPVLKSNIETCEGSSQVTVSSSNRMQEDVSSPNQALSSESVCDESAILKVMEFLALPRADAIHLLAQYNGNAEAVIQQIFA